MSGDLVNRLRGLAGILPQKHTLPSGADTVICSLEAFMQIKELAKDAADAIEELSKRVPRVPHGRLIDADALLDDLLFPSKQFEQGMKALIGDAPTIIPAEEAPAEDTNVPTGPYDLLYEEGGANTT